MVRTLRPGPFPPIRAMPLAVSQRLSPASDPEIFLLYVPPPSLLRHFIIISAFFFSSFPLPAPFISVTGLSSCPTDNGIYFSHVRDPAIIVILRPRLLCKSRPQFVSRTSPNWQNEAFQHTTPKQFAFS